MRLTDRDTEILQAMVTKVRLFSLRQIAEHWFCGDVANTRRRLRLLQARLLVEQISVRSRTLPEFAEPLIRWRPGQPEPRFEAVAYALQNRWNGRPVRESAAFIATVQASQLYGGVQRGELKNRLQATHDLGVSAVWLTLRQNAPKLAASWCGEDLLASTRRGQKLPDSFLLDAHGNVAAAIEFGGSYDAQRVEAFHLDCDDRSLPYQLW